MNQAKIKKYALLYVAAGAGTAAWFYSKGYDFEPGLLITWPLDIVTVSKAIKLIPNNGSNNGNVDGGTQLHSPKLNLAWAKMFSDAGGHK